MPTYLMLTCLLCLAALCSTPKAHAKELPKMALEAFDLQEVRLLEGPCLAAQEANRRYLQELDFDRLLYTFRQNAGLPTPGKPLGGWEAPTVEVRGHFIGHFLSACALMYASAGDEALKAKGTAMVAELAKCQQALGGDYLAAFPTAFWDRLEGKDAPWAPYYTIHKIMAGLLDMYQLCGDQQALDLLKGMARYFKGRFEKLSIWEVDRLLGVEFGGMSEVLHNLYGITGDPDHLWLAHQFDRASFLGPLALDHDCLSRLHANTHIPEISGAARRYELTGDERYRHLTEFFFDCVANHRSYVTGGSSVGEHWGDRDRLADSLSASNQESCTTYNILKVARYLIRWTADPKYADFYQRAFLNGILGTQNPADGMLIYFLPLASGNRKTYGSPYDAFWCCYGTGIESFSKLGDSIYFHDADSLYVNLLLASQVNWREKGVRVEQRTSFPEEAVTTLTFHCDRPTDLKLRVLVPSWATRGVQVEVKGEPVTVDAKPASYLTLERTWQEGDLVRVSLPMSLHAHPMPDDPEVMAFLYGPLVLAGLTDHPRYFLGDPTHLSDWVKPVGGKPLHFRTVGQDPDMELVPLNRILDETYGVYWLVTHEGSDRHKAVLAAEEAQRRREARILDRVLANDPASEQAHNLQGQNHSAGRHMDKGWRHALGDGWFSWDLKVLPDKPLTLCCTYWGSDVPPRTFDLLVDGRLLATQSLDRNRPGEFLNVEYAIPEEMTRGKQKVTVRFQAHPGNTAGGVFECDLLRPE